MRSKYRQVEVGTRVRMVSDMIDSGEPGQRVVAPAVKTNIPRGPKKSRVRPSPHSHSRRRRKI